MQLFSSSKHCYECVPAHLLSPIATSASSTKHGFD
jgi:hypothetical protein